MFEGQKERLQDARDEQLEWQQNDALRRGIYNSGILTENQNKTWDIYQDQVRRASQDAAMYQQQQRFQALNAILGARPMGYDLYQTDVGQYNTDLGRLFSQYNMDLDRQMQQYYGQKADHQGMMGDIGNMVGYFLNPIMGIF